MMLKYDREGPDISIFKTSLEKFWEPLADGVCLCPSGNVVAWEIPIRSVA